MRGFLILALLMLSAQLRSQTRVELQVSIPEKTTDSLFIAGSFNQWNPADPAYLLKKNSTLDYSIVLNLPKGDQEFKITRGKWATVESQNNGKAIANRILKVNVDTFMHIKVENWTDNFKNMEEEYQFGDHVHIVDSAFYMPQLKKYRKIWIYLPKSYKDSKKKYPVLYMHDGQNLFHVNPPRADEWAVDSVMDSLIRTGAKETIIVGIDHAGKDRLKEYNPYDSQYGKGEGKAYAAFLVETLKPFIDQHYRTKKEAKYTTIAGSSMGGLISIYTLSAYPDVFGAAGVFSPAFWLAPKIYADVSAQLPKLKNKKVFFVAGDKEGTAMIRDLKKVYSILNPDGQNKQVVFLEREDGKHTEWFWHREFESFYQFISK